MCSMGEIVAAELAALVARRLVERARPATILSALLTL